MSANNNDISTEDTALKNFEPYITELSEINLSLKKCINGVTINSKSASSILNDDLKQLEKLKGKVSAVVIANNNTPILNAPKRDFMPQTSKDQDLLKDLKTGVDRKI